MKQKSSLLSWPLGYSYVRKQQGQSPSNKATGESGLQLSGENDKLQDCTINNLKQMYE